MSWYLGTKDMNESKLVKRETGGLHKAAESVDYFLPAS